jgi:RNA polymerase sigma factor (sigma-70 family)
VADRDNDAWVTELKGQRGKQLQEKAFQDLGNALLSPVRWYLTNRSALPPGLSHGSFHDLDQLAQDIVQESLVSIWEKGLDSYRGEAKFITYAKAIAFNQARQKLRQMWRRKEVPLPPFDGEVAEEGNDERVSIAMHLGRITIELSPEKRIMLQEALRCMNRILTGWCTLREREAFVSKYLDNLRSKEIARLMNTTDRAVNMLTFSARNRLREGLEDEGYTLATLLHVLDC